MSTICWTVFHRARTPRAAHHAVHGIGHIHHPITHIAGKVLRHAPSIAARTRAWVELVCKVIPIAVGGGGLLVPHPLNPLPPPPAISAPGPVPGGPVLVPAFPPGWIGPGPGGGVNLGAGAGPGAGAGLGGGASSVGTPEPSSATILLIGVAGLMVVRLTLPRVTLLSAGRFAGPEPGPSQTKLIRGSPVV